MLLKVTPLYRKTCASNDVVVSQATIGEANNHGVKKSSFLKLNHDIFHL